MKDFIRMKERKDIQNKAIADAPQNIITVIPKHIKDQEVAEGALIRTIFNRFTGEEDSNRARKSYVREVQATSGALLVNIVGKPSKEARMGHNTITFIEKVKGIHQPHDDALVISITLADRKAFTVLVDNRSSTDILYVTTFDKMTIGREKLRLIHTPLIGFGRECLIHLGNIDLLVTIGEQSYQATKMVSFLVLEHPSVFNVILGRLVVNLFQVVTSTYHLMVKFPTKTRIRFLR